VAAFLREHPPFDDLPREDVERVADSAEVEFFLGGTTIFAQDAGAVEHLRVVRAGAVEIVLGGRVLDVLGPGELFGHASMLSGLPPGFVARAEQDTLCYRIPETVAAEVLTRPASARYLARSLLTMHARAPSALVRREATADPANRPVRTLIKGPPVICAPSMPLREVAAAMTAAGATAAVIELDDSLGIVTDRDLRSRVIAEGLSSEAPVSSAMTTPAYTAQEDDLAGEALIEMLDRGIGHLPILSATKRLIGVVRAIDLYAPETRSSFNLRRSISRAATYEELAVEAAGLGAAVVSLHDAHVGATSIVLAYSVLLDALTRRAIELALAGAPPPAPFAWLALGSQARREAVPSSDLDSALAWYGEDAEEQVRPALHALAETVTRELAACGLPVDTHGATAADSVFVRSIESWQHAARSRIEDPKQKNALILVSLLLDSRPVWGVHLGTQLSDTFREAGSRRELVHLLGRLAISNRPPTGFRRALVLDPDRGPRGELDIKRQGVLPVVDLARWAGVVAGVTSASTPERLRAAGAEEVLPDADVHTLQDALDLFTELRLAHHVAQMKAGVSPDDTLDTQELSPLARRQLREAFRAVASVQRRVASQLGLGFVIR
jgi:CBS domain-containing protein